MSPAQFRRARPADARIDQWTAADGWPLRRFEWPAAGTARGSILFQGGRGDMVEKYLETFAHWHDRGWSITSVDWRGQGGSGRLTDNPNCGHVERFEDFIDDFRGFFAEWRDSHPGPHVVIAHSMGGHLLLRALLEGAVAPDAAVLVAPMLGLHSPLGARGGLWLARLMGGLGNPARPAWKGNEKPYTTTTREHLLTHDHGRYEDELWWQGQDPQLVTGPPSWRWVIEAFRSTARVNADPGLARMSVPVLGLVADADGLVDARQAAATLGKVPQARIVRFGPESAHEILREVDPVRDRALAEIDGFLDAHAPQP